MSGVLSLNLPLEKQQAFNNLITKVKVSLGDTAGIIIHLTKTYPEFNEKIQNFAALVKPGVSSSLKQMLGSKSLKNADIAEIKGGKRKSYKLKRSKLKRTKLKRTKKKKKYQSKRRIKQKGGILDPFWIVLSGIILLYMAVNAGAGPMPDSLVESDGDYSLTE